MKTITIGSKTYTLEYTFEASLYSECIEQVIELMSQIFDAKTDGKTIKDVIPYIVNIPHTVLTMFYAGLLEHHSEEVRDKDEAKAILKEYFKENKGTDEGTFYGVMEQLIECMSDDDFFDQIGLGDKESKTVKMPQDHRRKQK